MTDETKQRDDGGPAFSGGLSNVGQPQQGPYYAGMSLHQHYAGKALEGFCSRRISNFSPKDMADRCLIYADAMIDAYAERGKR